MHAATDRLLRHFLKAVEPTVPLVALWGHGSLATDDYRPGRSDLDLIAVIDEPCEEGVARGVDSKALGVGRDDRSVQHCGTLGIQLDQEAARAGPAPGKRGGRKVGRVRVARHVNVSRGVGGDQERHVVAAASQVGSKQKCAVGRELGNERTPMFRQRLIEDEDLARALAAAHFLSAKKAAICAETSMLIALRQLICRYGDWTYPSVENEPASQRRFALYGDFIESSLDADLSLQTLADIAGVTRFQTNSPNVCTWA